MVIPFGPGGITPYVAGPFVKLGGIHDAVLLSPRKAHFAARGATAASFSARYSAGPGVSLVGIHEMRGLFPLRGPISCPAASHRTCGQYLSGPGFVFFGARQWFGAIVRPRGPSNTRGTGGYDGPRSSLCGFHSGRIAQRRARAPVGSTTSYAPGPGVDDGGGSGTRPLTVTFRAGGARGISYSPGPGVSVPDGASRRWWSVKRGGECSPGFRGV
jgi:hypothetical protein